MTNPPAIYKVGQVVGFKSDVEQYGTIVEVREDRYNATEYKVKASDRFHGEYIGGQEYTLIYEDQIFDARKGPQQCQRFMNST